MRPVLTALLLTLSLAASLVPLLPERGEGVTGASAPAGLPLLEKPTDLTADSITIDNSGTSAEAAGHVTIRYGELRATGDRLRLSRPARTATFTGHVTVTEPRGHASADSITLYVSEQFQVTRVVLAGNASAETPEYAVHADRIEGDRQASTLAASGHTSLFAAPDLTVTGTSAVYDLRTEYGVVSGDAATPSVVRNKDGYVQGSRIEVFRPAQRVVVHGPVEAEAYGATLRAENATVDLRREIAVVTGHVVLTRPLQILHADRVTVLYRDRRVIAEGATHMSVGGLSDSDLP